MEFVWVPGLELVELREVVLELKKKTIFQPLVSAIKRSTSVEAALMDLQESKDLISLIERTVEKGSNDPLAKAAEKAKGALFKMGVILYARATTDGSNSRSKLLFSSHLSGEDERRHNIILALRDKAIAHSDDTEGLEGGYWIREGMRIVQTKEDDIQFRFHSSRVNFKAGPVETLSAAIAVAEKVLTVLNKEVGRQAIDLLMGKLDDAFLKRSLLAHKKGFSGNFDE